MLNIEILESQIFYFNWKLIQNFLSAVPFYAQVQQGTPGIGDLRQYLMKISMVFYRCH
jgi:hypothetical protein